MRGILFFCLILVVFTSCEKDAGEGGTSVIEGKVYKIFTSQNPFSGSWDTSFFHLDSGKDVFIIYSDNSGSIYDDKFETDYNGRYHFEYLPSEGITHDHLKILMLFCKRKGLHSN